MGCMGHAIWLSRQLKHMTRLEDRTATQTQDNKTPSEALSRPAVNSSDEPMRGCNVCAHHPGGSKPAKQTPAREPPPWLRRRRAGSPSTLARA